MCRTLILFVIGILSSQVILAEDKIEISMEASVEKTGFVGQPFEYTVKLRSTIPSISNIKATQTPAYPQGLQVIRGYVSNQRPQEETVKGKKYYVWTIARNFLIPDREGKYTIPECRYIAFIPHEKIVQDYFWNNLRVVDYDEYPVTCKSVTFKANDLPEKGRPENFSGCVGEFSIEGWFPPGAITVGKEAIVAFTIKGFGSLEDLKFSNIYSIFKNGCSLREIEREDEKSQKNGKLYSEVTLICRFIPETEDGFISPLDLVFFNPEKKKYETVSSYTLHWDNKATKKSSGKIEAIEI